MSCPRFVVIAGTMALGVSSPLLAQSQCAPPTHLATHEPFQSTHYNIAPGQNNASVPPVPQNLPAGYRGHLTLLDLTANATLSVDRVDYRLNDDGFLRFTWGVQPGVSGGPGLVGQTTTVDVYMTPGTWTGNWTTPSGTLPKIQVPPGPGSPWTHLATGILTVAPHDQHSVAVFSTPFTVPVGANGFAFVLAPVTTPVPHISYAQPPYALHPSVLQTAAAPGAQTAPADQFLTISNQEIAIQAFVTLPPATIKTAVVDLHYTVAPTSAYYTAYGSACYDRPRAFYEEFAPGAVDLSNSSLQLTPSGGSYAVSAGSTAVRAPTTPPLTTATNAPLPDDARTGTLQLGFTFPYPGGSTSSIVVTTNGNVFLAPAASGSQLAAYNVFGPSGFVRGQPQLTAMWSDHDPSVNGSIHLDVDLSGPVPAAYVTWNGVGEWNQTNVANTFQVVMSGDGNVEFRYGQCSIVGVPSLVGFTAGFSAHDPGNRDLSATVPFMVGDGAVPPALRMDARPVVGTSPNMLATDLPANTTGVMLLGVPIHGIDLSFAGMPGCVSRIVPLAATQYQAAGTSASVPLQIPNNRILLGIGLTAQTVALSPGSNAAGATVSNAVCIRLGN
jgi:hypothetical protein